MPHLVKFGYVGWRFRGSQTQPHGDTVEDALRRGLQEIGAVEDGDVADVRIASRTDAGVSARGNAFTVDTEMDPDELVPALAAVTDDVHPWGHAEVPRGFDPRQARSRWYRYHLFYEGWDAKAIQETADVFQGEHDFAGFCRTDPTRDVETRRFLQSVEVTFRESFVTLDLEAPGFLWQQVRRIVAALQAVATGEVTRDDVERALDTGEGLGLEPAPPEPLVLVNVDLGVDVTAVERARQAIRDDVFEQMADHLTRAQVLKDLSR